MIVAIVGVMLFSYGSFMIGLDMFEAIRSDASVGEILVMCVESLACAAVAWACTLPIHP